MSYLQTVLLASARKLGRGVRSAQVRHRHITQSPMGMVLWQLGAEPFTAAAAAWGFGPTDRNLVVSGEPRNRDLFFRAMTRLASAFNPWFEKGEGQIVVPNKGTLSMLARLGRRLAYLPTDGDHPADPALVRFGRHLKFLGEHSRFPGQQLVLVLTDLLAAHWVCELSDLEAQNLAALDAAIAPPKGKTAMQAVEAAERVSVGPVPQDEDREVARLMADFNKARKGVTDEKVVVPLREDIERFYERLIFDEVWPLLWRCLERERKLTGGPSVDDRWQHDLKAVERHLEWVAKTGGITRVRQTSRQAAMTLRGWEEATRLLAAHEALDDPYRMIPFIMSSEAITGKVVELDMDHHEMGLKRAVLRPRVQVKLAGRCLVPLGKTPYWTKTPGSAAYTLVDKVTGRKGKGGDVVVLQHETSTKVDRPKVGETVIFSVHHTGSGPPLMLRYEAPWTHKRAVPESASLESDDATGGWE